MHHEEQKLPVDFVTEVPGAATARIRQLDAWAKRAFRQVRMTSVSGPELVIMIDDYTVIVDWYRECYRWLY